jgi:hypothetical protein
MNDLIPIGFPEEIALIGEKSNVKRETLEARRKTEDVKS